MNDLDPAWLRSFVAIARAGSITRAAPQVHRTQSAVSTHLQQLEACVGAHLVERSTRALALTAAGLAFLPHAQALLRAQDDAHAAVRPTREAITHRLGISEYFMPDRLGELLGVLRDAAGPARLELLLGTSAPLQRHWAQGDADLVVVTATTPPSGRSCCGGSRSPGSRRPASRCRRASRCRWCCSAMNARCARSHLTRWRAAAARTTCNSAAPAARRPSRRSAPAGVSAA